MSTSIATESRTQKTRRRHRRKNPLGSIEGADLLGGLVLLMYVPFKFLPKVVVNRRAVSVRMLL